MFHLERLVALTITQVGPVAPGGAMASLMSFAPIVLMFGVVYFVMLRPANKQREVLQKTLAALKKDDQVITTGGVYGRVLSLDEKTLSLEVADRVKIKILRDRIAGLASETSSTTGTGN